MAEIPNDIMQAAAASHAEFADSRCRDNLGVIIARAILTERERCAMIADQWEAKGDEKFAECIADHDRGRKNLQLAAAACAGMSHQARGIAATIRGGSHV